MWTMCFIMVIVAVAATDMIQPEQNVSYNGAKVQLWKGERINRLLFGPDLAIL